MFQKNLIGEAQIFSNSAHLILEEIAQRFNQGKGHFFRQTSHVVMGLDSRGGPFYRDGLDHIGIQGSLNQEPNFSVSFAALQLLRLFGEDSDEFPADAPAFLLWIGDSLELREKSFGSVHADDAQA